jgi:hypothetical protein
MTRQVTACRWRWCPRCGRERRLARGGTVMGTHNRWDPATAAMVWCEGSGQPPRLNGHARPAVEEAHSQSAAGPKGLPTRPDAGAA